MGFKTTIVVTVLLSGVFGGGVGYLNSTGQVSSLDDIAYTATRLYRATLRKLEPPRYERGPEFGMCVTDYGGAATGRTNAEITYACECFDKGVRGLSDSDRQAALDGLHPVRADANGGKAPDPAILQLTGPAQKLLSRCGIGAGNAPAVQRLP